VSQSDLHVSRVPSGLPTGSRAVVWGPDRPPSEAVRPDPAPARPRTRTIEVSAALGRGPTTLAAFDDALLAAGVGNHNLIRLSSVIPTDTEIVVCDGPVGESGGAWGDRLYVVMAECRTHRAGEEAWAGIGWVQEEESGRGLFVEHEGHDRERVSSDIDASLAGLVAGRPDVEFGPVTSLVRGGVCVDEPICALVIAVYESEGWTIDLRGLG
jgi:arginine decarboxylase